MTTRGFKKREFIKVGNIIYECLSNLDNKDIQKKLKKEVLELTSKYPLSKVM